MGIRRLQRELVVVELDNLPTFHPPVTSAAHMTSLGHGAGGCLSKRGRGEGSLVARVGHRSHRRSELGG